MNNASPHDRQTITQKRTQLPALPRLSPNALVVPPNSVAYDEQLGTAFTQNFTSLAYTVTAVAQSGSDGYGPAYLVNGLGNTGYWYQVGLAYNWDPVTAPGFHLAYSVFGPSGNVVFPVNTGAGITTISPVNPGDTVLLSLSFSNGNVVMQATDQTTGAQSQETYSAAGSTYFVGSPSSIGNSQGFFTGLMTEWYHSVPYYAGEQSVTYNDKSGAITSAWLFMDEFSVSKNGVGGTVFSDYTRSPLIFSNPTQLQLLSSNGATESTNATQFITGQTATVTLTFDYSVIGGTVVPNAPVLTYVTAGVPQTVTLTQSGQAFSVDAGTSWSITNPLSASTSTERWQTDQATSDTATSSQTVDFVFYQQFLVTFNFNVIGGGANYATPSAACQEFGRQISPTMGIQIWADATQYSFSSTLAGSSSSERWATNSPFGTVSTPGSITVEYFHQYLTTTSYSIVDGGTPAPPTFSSTSFGTPLSQTLTIPPEGLWIDSGASYTFPNLLPGSTSTEQWQTTATLTRNIASSTTINIPYYHQYYVAMVLNPAAGGSTSTMSQWYNAGASFQAEASPNNGWQFENWSGSGQGSYSGDNTSALTTVDAPVTETANFYPGLTVSVSSKILVSYTYGATVGQIPSDTIKTIYAPPGTNIKLTGNPKLFIYSFGGWTGSMGDNRSNVSTVLDAPQNIDANFSYNYIIIGIISAVILAVIVAAVVLIFRGRRQSRDASFD